MVSQRPHIVIINPDEMRADFLGHLGNRAVSTPHLDEFAATEAVSFSNAFCQNPVCVPSRCSFLTGLYPHTRGHRTMQHLLHEEESSLFSELKDAGYYVWLNSRNDLYAGQFKTIEEKHSSEVFYQGLENPGPIKTLEELRNYSFGARSTNGAAPDYRSIYHHYQGVLQTLDGNNNTASKDTLDTLAACERILHPVDPDKPLCIFLGWLNPHPEYVTSPEYMARVDSSKLPERARYKDTTNKSLMIDRLHELTMGDTFTEQDWTDLRAVYAAQCTFVDDNFALVIDALKQAGIYDDTAIFFLSDHGDFAGDYDLPEKSQNTFEHCLTRVPFLVKPPKGTFVDPGISDSLVELIDFYATVMDMAGVTPDHTQFGRSITPILADRSQSIRPYVFCEGGRNEDELHCDEWHVQGPSGASPVSPYWPKQKAQTDPAAHEKGTMMFDGRYKYVHRLSGKDEFYDLETDPLEKHNIIADTDRDTILAFKEAMLDWYQRTCDVVPLKADSRSTRKGLLTMLRSIIPPGEEDRYLDAVVGMSPPRAILTAVNMRIADADNT